MTSTPTYTAPAENKPDLISQITAFPNIAIIIFALIIGIFFTIFPFQIEISLAKFQNDSAYDEWYKQILYSVIIENVFITIILL